MRPPATRLRTHPAGRRRASALLLGLVMLTLAGSIVVAFLTMTSDSARRTGHDSDRAILEAAAESAITLAVDRVWGSFEAARANEQRTTQWDFRAFMDDEGVLAQASDDPTEAATTSLLADVRLGSDGGLGGVSVDSLEVYRVDDFASSRLVFRATFSMGQSQDARRLALEHTYSVEPASWQGLDFGLLANNITCTSMPWQMFWAPSRFRSMVRCTARSTTAATTANRASARRAT